MHTIESVLSKLDKTRLTEKFEIKIVMDKKLSDDHQKVIGHTFQKYIGTKKGITVRCASSTKERGIQLADLIAGAFRAKLLKRSGLFEVDYTHIFQITSADIKQLEVRG